VVAREGPEIVVEMRNIKKVYPDGTVALRGVDFTVGKGEIVGLLGENGAGKTTLMKILSGLLQPTDGEIYVRGERVRFRHPSDALKMGIGMVHQHFVLVPTFTPVENVLLTEEGDGGILRSLSPLKYREVRERLERLMKETGLSAPLDTPVELLPVGVRQRVEILKVLYRGTDVLILDEPTSYLSPIEVVELFKVLRRLKEAGKSIVFITHKIKEALEISDRIVVLRGGLVVGEVDAEDATPERLAVMMVGRRIAPKLAKEPGEPGEPVLIVKDLCVMSDTGVLAVKNVSFEVREGEIFGIAGVEGNGQSELVQAIVGLRQPVGGEIWYRGAKVVALNPRELYKMGLSHIPEDRDRMGLALDMNVLENSILGRQDEPEFLQKPARLNWRRIEEYARSLVEKFNVVAPSLRAPARSLSGGNRQRLVAGRELSKNPVLIVAAHPTRGLDVASTMYIRELLVKMRNEGKGVLLVSADLDEILELSDRIAVMYKGEFVGMGRVEEFTIEEIGMLMGGVVPREGARPSGEKMGELA